MQAESLTPNPWMMLPFVLLLGSIALGPLLAGKWWLKHYAKVALALGGVTIAYYLFGLQAHARVLAISHEYLSFMALIGSLFVVSGGINVNVKGQATPGENVFFLLFGAIIANFLGTTGASMLLIRPWIRMNKYRVTGHHIVFFIFIVSNVGGCLTPIGDPPLFLGYLKGIPFWWVAQHCWPIWATGLGILLIMFYLVDYKNYKRAPKTVQHDLAEPADQWKFEGLGNLFFLGLILAAVFIDQPLFLREGIMIVAALGSYFTTRKAVHQANEFSFHPLQEVAILFVGIFATMMPALDWLKLNAGGFGEASPTFYFWASGSLSSVLDNAPTYLSFFTAMTGAVPPEVVTQVTHLVQNGGADLAAVTGSHAEEIRRTFAALQQYQRAAVAAKTVTLEAVRVAFLLGNPAMHQAVVALSVGAVFFGANTYIGNGPNFMVKSIAEQHKIHTPGFIGFILKFTLPFMLPMVVLIWWIFFR